MILMVAVVVLPSGVVLIFCIIVVLLVDFTIAQVTRALKTVLRLEMYRVLVFFWVCLHSCSSPTDFGNCLVQDILYGIKM